jgi:hypothetical protein
MYANLCIKLNNCYVVNAQEKKIYFRELLLNKCQQIFENITNMKSESELRVHGLNFKEDVFGCIAFIGELYNHQLLTDKIICTCLLILLKRISEEKLFAISLMSLMLETIAKLFCKECPDEANLIFSRLKLLSSSNTISKRDKFSLLDALDKIEELGLIDLDL